MGNLRSLLEYALMTAVSFINWRLSVAVLIASAVVLVWRCMDAAEAEHELRMETRRRIAEMQADKHRATMDLLAGMSMDRYQAIGRAEAARRAMDAAARKDGDPS